RAAQFEQSDYCEGSLATEGGREVVCRSAGRAQRRLRRHVQAGVPEILPVDRRSGSGTAVSAIRGWTAPAHDSGGGTAESSKAGVDGRAGIPGGYGIRKTRLLAADERGLTRMKIYRRSSALLTIRFLFWRDEFPQAAFGMRRLTVALEAAITAVVICRP